MIDLTPLDVRKKKGDFARGLRGYDPAAVDHFLDLVAERMEELVRENIGLRERNAQANETLAGFRERERALNEALVTAQQMREEMRAQAGREAELAMQEARAEAERISGEALSQVAIASAALRRTQTDQIKFLRTFRAFVERQLADVQQEEEHLREILDPPHPPAE